MKNNLDLATKLHYELNLDNFYVANIRQWGVNLQGWYTPDFEKLLFEKGFQVQWNENLKHYRYDSDDVVIILTYKEI